MHCITLKLEKPISEYMKEKPKNLSQNLTDNEKDMLYRLGLTYITKFYSLQERYPDPKVYAKRKLLNKLDSDSSLAFCHTLLFMKDLTSDVTKSWQKKFL